MLKDKFQKKCIIIFDIVLALGLLAHSTLFLIKNNYFSMTETIIDSNGELVFPRILIRSVAETFLGVCSFIYFIGNIVMLWYFVKKHKKASFKEILFYFAMQTLIMLLCTIPFGLLDMFFFYDYIFPVYEAVLTLFIILCIFTIINKFMKTSKNNIPI